MRAIKVEPLAFYDGPEAVQADLLSAAAHWPRVDVAHLSHTKGE